MQLVFKFRKGKAPSAAQVGLVFRTELIFFYQGGAMLARKGRSQERSPSFSPFLFGLRFFALPLDVGRDLERAALPVIGRKERPLLGRSLRSHHPSTIARHGSLRRDLPFGAEDFLHIHPRPVSGYAPDNIGRPG
eukprot:1555820-Amphidinium_carterae.1